MAAKDGLFGRDAGVASVPPPSHDPDVAKALVAAEIDPISCAPDKFDGVEMNVAEGGDGGG